MDNFRTIYKILSTLEAALDYPAFDIDQISAEKLGISEARRACYLEMMADTGLIKGVKASLNIMGELEIRDAGIKITLAGLEYLSENTIMKRIYNAAKGVTDLIP